MQSPAKLATKALPASSELPSWRVILVITSWVLAILVGFLLLIGHDLRAGSFGTSQRSWPTGTSLNRSASGPTIVMFVHPHCPCTAASLEQLSLLAGQDVFRSATINILIADVADAEDGHNVSLARQLPRACVAFDTRDAEAQRFGSHTSGDLFIFDAQGRLAFRGGITAARGHQGQNPAAAAALAAAQGESRDLVRMPVFGCALSRENPGSVD